MSKGQKKNPIPVAWMKVYDANGNYQASCVDIAAAAALMSFYGNGAEIRNGHAKKSVLWREGSESQPAGESYDFVVGTVQSRTFSEETEPTPEQKAQDERAQASLEQTRATVRRMMEGQ
jgi:hypothetical protein